MASAALLEPQASSGWSAARVPDRNKTTTNCLRIGLIFGMTTRFFRPPSAGIRPACRRPGSGHARNAVPERAAGSGARPVRDANNAAACSNAARGLVLFALISANHDFDRGHTARRGSRGTSATSTASSRGRPARNRMISGQLLADPLRKPVLSAVSSHKLSAVSRRLSATPLVLADR